MAKDGDECGITQRLAKSERVSKRLGAFHRGVGFFKGTIRVAENPGYERQIEFALDSGMAAGPIREFV